MYWRPVRINGGALAGSVDEAAVKAALADRVAKYKQPKAVFIVDELPRNTMGKVQKNVLRDSYKDTFG